MWLWEEYCLRHGFNDPDAFARDWQPDEDLIIPCSFEVIIRDEDPLLWTEFVATVLDMEGRLVLSAPDQTRADLSHYRSRLFQAFPELESDWDNWLVTRDRLRTLSGTTTIWWTTSILSCLDNWLNERNSAGGSMSLAAVRRISNPIPFPTIFGPPLGVTRYSVGASCGHSVVSPLGFNIAGTHTPAALMSAPSTRHSTLDGDRYT